MISELVTKDARSLDPAEIFSHLPPSRCGQSDRRYMNEVLDAGFGNWESAQMLERFETAFAEKFGVPYAISHNSGSGTLLSCLLAAGVGPGDEVIVPACTMAATAFVVLECGAVPVFADSDPRTFNMDPADVRRKLSPFTRAIIPVHIFGLPADLDPIMELARQHNLTVIEDSAQCFLATYKGRLAGTLGHAASFSLQGSKHMTTAGDGGMVITSDAELGRNVRKAAVQGYRTLDARPGATMIPRDERQDWNYKRHDRLGYNFRMSAVQAALGLAQLERLDYLVAAPLDRQPVRSGHPRDEVPLAHSAGRARRNDPQLLVLCLPPRRRDAGHRLAHRSPDLYQARWRWPVRRMVAGASGAGLSDDDVLRTAGALAPFRSAL